MGKKIGLRKIGNSKAGKGVDKKVVKPVKPEPRPSFFKPFNSES